MIRRRVVVHGVVQGVFYRVSCRDEAVRAGLGGWVRNREDGTVEAVFEGSPGDVEALCDWCRRGPAGARVDGVDVLDEAPDGVRGFEVR